MKQTSGGYRNKLCNCAADYKVEFTAKEIEKLRFVPKWAPKGPRLRIQPYAQKL